MDDQTELAPAVRSILSAARNRATEGRSGEVAVEPRDLRAAFDRAEADGRVPLIAEVKPTSPTTEGTREDDPVALAQGNGRRRRGRAERAHRAGALRREHRHARTRARGGRCARPPEGLPRRRIATRRRRERRRPADRPVRRRRPPRPAHRCARPRLPGPRRGSRPRRARARTRRRRDDHRREQPRPRGTGRRPRNLRVGGAPCSRRRDADRRKRDRLARRRSADARGGRRRPLVGSAIMDGDVEANTRELVRAEADDESDTRDTTETPT